MALQSSNYLTERRAFKEIKSSNLNNYSDSRREAIAQRSQDSNEIMSSSNLSWNYETSDYRESSANKICKSMIEDRKLCKNSNQNYSEREYSSNQASNYIKSKPKKVVSDNFKMYIKHKRETKEGNK